MLTAQVDKAQITKLSATLKGDAKKIKREVAIAINAVGKKTEAMMAKEVGKELATPQKNIKKAIYLRSKATPAHLGTTVSVPKAKRLPLRDFNPRQNRTGVSYKVSKTKGRGFVAGAFQGPKPGVIKASWRGNVFKRTGKSRLPIIKLKGPSVWGVVVKGDTAKVVASHSRDELKFQIDRRIRFQILKQRGAI